MQLMSPFGRLCCKTLFGSLTTIFPGCGRGDRILMWGTTSFCDELTGDFGGAFEAISIDGCRLFCCFSEKIAASHFWSFATQSAPKRTSAERADQGDARQCGFLGSNVDRL